MDDKSIIDLLWQRIEQGLEEIHKKYGGFLFNLAYNLLSNREDSEECVNDGYLKTWNSIPPTRPRNLKYFIGSIVRNLAIDKIKHDQAEKRGKNTTLILSELEECIPSNCNIAEQYIKDEMLHEISEYVKKLDPFSRQIFLRRYWLGQSLAQISKITGLSENNLAGKLFKIRQQIKSMLIKEETL